ncbi:1-phosphofructokinase [Paraconexibacter algicola]|uniref:1-phosphofructokinase n=1 Tax=Paraconexibacter algicola TaxID=2133960 RepID=A0A2T4UKC7_9ACTN|nr:1-phosphofructokinase [Paraconexibacter algicola]PTL59667.1 1-phosphofructokinase [Paraconexibacter algicola]
MTVVTLTANPSVDRTCEIDALRRGAVLRPLSTRVDAGGKGVNVARALHAAGAPNVAVLPVGGHEGAQLVDLLAAAGLRTRTVPIAGAIRANVTIAEPDGTTTKLNEPGPVLDADEVAALQAALLDEARTASWAVLSGSLPPGCPVDLYARLTVALHAAGVRVALDCDGEVLQAALPAGPDLVKPNRTELAQATGLEVHSAPDAVRAAHALRELGARAVLASLGSRGAVLLDDSGEHHAHAAVDAPRSTVGAGDAALAGFLAAGAHGPDALDVAVAYGAAAVALPGSRMPTPADLRPDAVRRLPVRSQEALS